MWEKYLEIKERDDRIKSFQQRFELVKTIYRCGCAKEKGISVATIIIFLLKLVFTGKNLYRALESGESELKKDTVYRFLNSLFINWHKVLIAITVKVYRKIASLTSDDRASCFVLDDSIYNRNRSKKVELLAKVYDHVFHKYMRGFRNLTLGWTDGNTFLPIAFNLLSSTEDKNVIYNARNDIDKRSNAYKIRKQARENTLDRAIGQLKSAMSAGITAKYCLFDSWFSFPSFIKRVTELKTHVIAMMKDHTSKCYVYNGEKLRLSALFCKIRKMRREANDGNVYFAEVITDMVVSEKEEEIETIPVKIVFVQSIGRKREWVAIVSTDISISDEEIVRIYGKRWSIEVFFKSCKSDLAMAKEFQGRSYAMLTAHTTIVYLRYIMLAIECRTQDDLKTCGELFWLMVDEIMDIKLDESVRLLVETMLKSVEKTFNPSDEAMRDYCTVFLGSLPPNLRAKFVFDNCES